MRKKITGGDVVASPGPLDAQLTANNTVKARKAPKRKLEKEDNVSLINPKLTRRILKSALSQKAEDEAEKDATASKSKKSQLKSEKSSKAKLLGSDGEEDEDDVIERESDDDESPSTVEKQSNFADKVAAFESFNMSDIKSMIEDKRTEIEAEFTDIGSTCSELSDDLKEHYLIAKKWLHSYRAGAIPKAIKCLPTNRLWEEIMELLHPERFTAASVCALTFYFAKASVGRNAAQSFYKKYLLPRVRDDISEYKRLNFHLARAIQHALFQPAAFTTGFLLPLCRSGASLAEASIIGGLLRKFSIPVKFASVMLSLLVGLPYSGGTAVLLRSLLEKKYNFPIKVVQLALERPNTFFTGSGMDYEIKEPVGDASPNSRPVLWHQALLSLVERYSAGFTAEQRKIVLALCRKHHHPEISPEVRKALRHIQQDESNGGRSFHEAEASAIYGYEKEDDIEEKEEEDDEDEDYEEGDEDMQS